MKRLLYLLFLIPLFFSSCATMFGGGKYRARIVVPDHPNAKIEYMGSVRGMGDATVLVPRKDADKLSLKISEKDCEAQMVNYHRKVFRGWAFTGSLLGWTGLLNGIPLPWGIAVDGINGAFWKPDVRESGIFKEDYNNYIYQINYNGCKTEDGLVGKLEEEPQED
ncbi:hypothetical protein [Persicobacter sp. CCB-QB2]|uniref:hypothetical protein n=1 Tax=Persicobacter sp. CCB-QB2 TaxID=1561025 RepID=UPI0012F79161|nr:hypothetical protein [Persicobacter sp. CCB-QB2]